MGVTDTDPFPLDYNIFTTFLKARLTCVSTGDNTEPPYYYNELRKSPSKILGSKILRLKIVGLTLCVFALAREKF